jgi:hypothetical protein
MPLLAGLGLLTVIVAIPLARRVPPNRWYGLRVPATLADNEVWYAANQRTGRDLAWLGLALVVVAFALPALAPAVPTQFQPLVYVGVAVVGSLVTTIRGVRTPRGCWRNADAPRKRFHRDGPPRVASSCPSPLRLLPRASPTRLISWSKGSQWPRSRANIFL